MSQLESAVYVRDAREALSRHRSYVWEVLTSPLDQHVRDNLLDSLDTIERSLNRAVT